MPRETNPTRIAEIIRILRESATDYVDFKPRAQDGKIWAGSSRVKAEAADLGLDGLPFPKNYTRRRRADLFRRAAADGIEDGSAKLNKIDRDYAEEYEIRFSYLGMDLYVKLLWVDSSRGDSMLELHEIKLQD